MIDQGFVMRKDVHFLPKLVGRFSSKLLYDTLQFKRIYCEQKVRFKIKLTFTTNEKQLTICRHCERNLEYL